MKLSISNLVQSNLIKRKSKNTCLKLITRLESFFGEKAYCTQKNELAKAKSLGASTGKPTVCSECGASFGIHPRNVQNLYREHVEYSRLPEPIYKLIYFKRIR